MTECQFISAADLAAFNQKECLILDVRTNMEHKEKHLVQKHFHVPLDQLDPHDFAKLYGLNSDSEIFILCRSGKRAQAAAEQFKEAGYPNIRVIDGGIISCEGCGVQVAGTEVAAATTSPCCSIPGKSGGLSLERQVRVAAGLIIALGSVMGLWLNPLFVFIPLIVGCGLIFAGLTNRCGLALLLTKAPWNR